MEYKYNEKTILFWTLILAVLINELFLFGGFGIAVPLYIVIYYVFIFLQAKRKNIKIDIKENMLFLPIIMAGFCFLLFDNLVLKILNILFLWILIILNTADIYSINSCEKYSLKWFINIYEVGMLYPFVNIFKCMNVIKDFKSISKEKANRIFKVSLGLFIGLFMTIIIVPILMRSDAAFTGIIENIFMNINFKVFTKILRRLITLFMIFFPMYSFIYGITHYEKEKILKSDNYNLEILDFTIAITVISIICAIYILFCFSQLTYFISAFQGILPKDYTFSEYARRGFFECIPLTMINVAFVVLLDLFVKDKKSIKKKKVLNIYMTFITIFTLFLVISALSKMILYISAYGLTILRIYTAWFLILLSVILVCICIKIYSKKFNLLKNVFIIFVAMFIGLNYCNIDYVIGRYNANLYIEKNVDTISSFDSLSVSAVKPLLEMGKYDSDADYMLYKYEKRLENNNKWQSFNIAKYNAYKSIEKN